jgi:hypothetical protein
MMLSSIAWAGAQISVDILVDQTQYLRDESVPVKVHITNLSGQPIPLGQEPDWLSFQVEYSENGSASCSAPVAASEPFTLQSAKAVMRQFNLMPYFDFSRMGRYTVTATVRIKSWNQVFQSNPKNIEISAGFNIWEHEFGVPSATNGPPEMRKYSLLQANNQNRLVLYARVADITDTKAIRVLPIATLVSFSKPEAQIDQDSNLHILTQTGAWAFAYMVVSPQGDILVRQRFDYTQTRPILRPQNGKIVVFGGIRHLTTEDIPTSPMPTNTLTNAAPGTNQIATNSP